MHDDTQARTGQVVTAYVDSETPSKASPVKCGAHALHFAGSAHFRYTTPNRQ